MRLRHQPVIGVDGDETLPRQRASRKAIAATLAAVPAAAVEEDDHRQAIALLGVFGHPDIERLARPAAIGRVDRKSVVYGKMVAVRVDLGGRRIIKNKKK